MTTIAAQRIEKLVAEATALGCRVHDETGETGVRTVQVSGAHWLDRDSVLVTYTPASHKDRKGARDSLFCMIFSNTKYPRKHRAVVEFHEAYSYIEGLKDYSAHTHCRPGHHVHDEPRCTALTRDDGTKPCGVPRSMHSFGYDHAHTTKEN